MATTLAEEEAEF
jgi:hypothetical protein